MQVQKNSVNNDERRHLAPAAHTKAEDRVETNLARLLLAIWRKLREESALLDFFLTVAENCEADGSLQQRGGLSETAGAAAVAKPVTVHRLDVFDRLLPLLELPGRAGLHAREACLVALSVQDRRVGQFVADNTLLCAQLSQTLTARYLALYDTLEELQVAAASPQWEEKGDYARGGDHGVTVDPETQLISEQIEETFTEALSLFLQHLRFCNAVGLVAADTQACLRVPERAVRTSINSQSKCGEDGEENNAILRTKKNSPGLQGDERVVGSDCVPALLASQLRQLLLGGVIGPALSSALDSRAGFAQAITARMIAELSSGVEGHGVTVAGTAACVGEGGGCRRQLGPLLDMVASFLVGRECSWKSSTVRVGEGELPTQPNGNTLTEEAYGALITGSTDVIDKTSASGNGSLRDVFLRRIGSPCSRLHVSTLELMASLAELRDDRVLLDLVLRPYLEGFPDQESSTMTPTHEVGNEDNGSAPPRRCQLDKGYEGIQALLDGSFSGVGALDGIRVSREMVDSFGSAFGGSPIHPSFGRFGASHGGLEGYLVAAHQRQVQQLMEGVRPSRKDDEGKNWVPKDGAGGKGVIFMEERDVQIEGGRRAQKGREATSEGAIRGEEQFDYSEFVREHGETLATTVDVEGSFIYALFDCLEVRRECRLAGLVSTF